MKHPLNEYELDQLLRQRFGQGAVPPPPEVWDRLSSRMEGSRPRPVRWRVAKGVMAAVLAILPLVVEYPERGDWQVLGQAARSEAKAADMPQEAAPRLPKRRRPADPPAQAPVAQSPGIRPAQAAMLADSMLLAQVQAIPAKIEPALQDFPEVEPERLRQDRLLGLMKPIESPFYFGLHAQAAFIGILNQNTYGSFGPYEPAYKPSAMRAAGVHAGMRISRYWWLEAGVTLFALQGQEYRDVISGRKVYRKVQLVYHHVPIVLRREQTMMIAGKRLRSYMEGGVQYGRLLQARVRVNYQEQGMYQRFRPNEWALLMGRSVDLPLNAHLVLNAGVYATVSSDINDKKWRVPDGYGRSHNVAAGVRLSLNFR